jgi:hypothetical protein
LPGDAQAGQPDGEGHLCVGGSCEAISPEGEAASQETPDPFIKLVGHVAHETRVNRPEIVVDLGNPADPPEEVRSLERELVVLQKRE